MNDLIAERDALKAEVERLKGLIDRDRTGLAAGLNAVIRAATGWDWICEGRGPYRYDDDRYRMEVGSLITQVVATAQAALQASGARAHEAFYPRAQLTAQALTEACAEDEEHDPCARCSEQPAKCQCTGGWQDPTRAEHTERVF